MTQDEGLLESVCWFARRALQGQTPSTLRAYSFAVDGERRVILLRAHFAETPSEDDLSDISVVETEIDADFLDLLEGEIDVEIAPPGTACAFLSGGIVYLRDGEPGTTCTA